MNGYSTDVAELSARNRKKAYFAMCRVSLLLFAVALFSWGFRFVTSLLFANNGIHIQTFFVKALSLAGVSTQSAVAAAKAFVSSAALAEFVGLVETLITIVFPYYLFAKHVKLFSDETFCVDGKCIKGIFSIFCLCQLVTVTVSFFAKGFYEFLLPDAAAAEDAARAVMGAVSEEDVFGFIIRILCVCVFVPVAEEYAFRGVAFSYLKRYGLVFGVVASAALFGIAHSSPVQSMYAFGFGLISAFAVAVTGNIKTSIVLHSANNLITVISEYLPQKLGEANFEIVYSLYTMLVMAFAFFGLYKICTKNGHLEAFRKRAVENDGSIAIKPGMFEVLAFPFVVYIIYYVLNIVLKELMS